MKINERGFSEITGSDFNLNVGKYELPNKNGTSIMKYYIYVQNNSNIIKN